VGRLRLTYPLPWACQESCVRGHNRSAGQYGYQVGYAGSALGRDPQAVFSKDGLFDELKKALAERILNAEPDDHLEAEAAEGRIAQEAAIPRRLAKQPLAVERKQSLPSFNPAYSPFRKSTSSVFTC
jgi:hypothetical protein